jgi:hypothetical protein
MWAKEIGALEQTTASRPRGIASLIESYIRRILMPATNRNETLVDRLRNDAAKIADRELSDRYTPGYVTRSTALDIMRSLDPADPDKRFALLEKSRLVESPSQYSDAVHIAPDPVAEHLVARLRIQELQNNLEAWERFLSELQRIGAPPEFMSALAACAEDQVYGSPIPQQILRNIENIRIAVFSKTISTQRGEAYAGLAIE